MSAVATTQFESTAAWTRLESSPQWAALTEQQRIWVTQFLATGSALLATRTAYKAKSEANARVLSYEIAKNHRILAALDVAAGKASPVKTERERLIATEQRQRKQLIATVRKQLKAADKGSVAAQRLLAQLERLTLGSKMGRPRLIDDQDEPESEPSGIDGGTFDAPKTAAEPRIPAGATAWHNKTTGAIIGYRTADGRDVQI